MRGWTAPLLRLDSRFRRRREKEARPDAQHHREHDAGTEREPSRPVEELERLRRAGRTVRGEERSTQQGDQGREEEQRLVCRAVDSGRITSEQSGDQEQIERLHHAACQLADHQRQAIAQRRTPRSYIDAREGNPEATGDEENDDDALSELSASHEERHDEALVFTSDEDEYTSSEQSLAGDVAECYACRRAQPRGS